MLLQVGVSDNTYINPQKFQVRLSDQLSEDNASLTVIPWLHKIKLVCLYLEQWIIITNQSANIVKGWLVIFLPLHHHSCAHVKINYMCVCIFFLAAINYVVYLKGNWLVVNRSGIPMKIE